MINSIIIGFSTGLSLCISHNMINEIIDELKISKVEKALLLIPYLNLLILLLIIIVRCISRYRNNHPRKMIFSKYLFFLLTGMDYCPVIFIYSVSLLFF